MDNLPAQVQIKGLRDGLLVSLAEAGWEEQRSALLAQIDGQQQFFHGARLALEVGGQILKVNELVELRDRLSERNVSLWAVISDSPTTEKTAQLLGLATRISKPRPEETHIPDAPELGDGTALFVNRTLRSGARVDFTGHVILLGDVNPGAEVIAEGNIVIWGRLRGSVHAGAKGNQSSVVCALDFSPIRLQIADSVMNNTEKGDTSKPVTAFIQNERVVLEIWQTG